MSDQLLDFDTTDIELLIEPDAFISSNIQELQQNLSQTTTELSRLYSITRAKSALQNHNMVAVVIAKDDKPTVVVKKLSDAIKMLNDFSVPVIDRNKQLRTLQLDGYEV